MWDWQININSHTDQDLARLLKAKTNMLFIQASLGQFNKNLWMEVYTLVFCISTREIEHIAYQILCDLCKENPHISCSLLSDVKYLPSDRQPLLHLIWALNKVTNVPRELKLKIFYESRNIDLVRGYNIVFDAFAYLKRFWLYNQLNSGDGLDYLWGEALLRQCHKM
jgi:hypothetical protein